MAFLIKQQYETPYWYYLLTESQQQEDICLESKDTVKEVKECPNGSTTFIERSNKKNCSRYPKCAGESLAYHCVRSGESLVEVCAPITSITGIYK